MKNSTKGYLTVCGLMAYGYVVGRVTTKGYYINKCKDLEISNTFKDVAISVQELMLKNHEAEIARLNAEKEDKEEA